MHVHFLDPYRPLDSPIHRFDPRLKLVLAIGLILTCTLVPAGGWPIYILLYALILSVELLSELGVGYIMRRSALAIPFILAALPLILTTPGNPWFSLPVGSWTLTASYQGLERFISIAIKSWVSVQAAILLLVGRLVFGIQNQGSFLDLLLIMTLGTGCFMAFGFALSGFAETSEGYAAISNLVFFPLMLLSGVYFTLDSAPAWLRHAVAAMPLAPFLRALRAVFNDGGTLAGHGVGLAIVAAWGCAAFALAVRRFRWA